MRRVAVLRSSMATQHLRAALVHAGVLGLVCWPGCVGEQRAAGAEEYASGDEAKAVIDGLVQPLHVRQQGGVGDVFLTVGGPWMHEAGVTDSLGVGQSPCLVDTEQDDGVLEVLKEGFEQVEVVDGGLSAGRRARREVGVQASPGVGQDPGMAAVARREEERAMDVPATHDSWNFLKDGLRSLELALQSTETALQDRTQELAEKDANEARTLVRQVELAAGLRSSLQTDAGLSDRIGFEEVGVQRGIGVADAETLEFWRRWCGRGDAWRQCLPRRSRGAEMGGKKFGDPGECAGTSTPAALATGVLARPEAGAATLEALVGNCVRCMCGEASDQEVCSLRMEALQDEEYVSSGSVSD